MKMELPSGVSTYPVLAIRLNVWVLPETDPGAQTIPVVGAPGGRAPAFPGKSTAAPANRVSTRPSRRVFPVIMAILSRRTDVTDLDIGLAHVLLGRQEIRVDPDLGHHSARGAARAGSAQARQASPVAVLEVVAVVRPDSVRSGRLQS